LFKNKPDRVIIAAGMNDLLYEKENSNPAEVVERVIDIGKRAREKGVKDVFILGLYQVDGVNVNIFNHILRQRCLETNFGYVYNSNIDKDDLYDGLHVNNRVGTNKLKHNVMQCFTTYIHNR